MMVPEVLKRPLVFGDDAQFRALKAMEESQRWCKECQGDGVIETKCGACNGTGENKGVES